MIDLMTSKGTLRRRADYTAEEIARIPSHLKDAFERVIQSIEQTFATEDELSKTRQAVSVARRKRAEVERVEIQSRPTISPTDLAKLEMAAQRREIAER